MSDLRKAAKDLLHEYDSGIFDDDHDLIHAMNALRDALAAPSPALLLRLERVYARSRQPKKLEKTGWEEHKMNDREAMKLALDALELWRNAYPKHWNHLDEQAEEALRAALAAPRPEPVPGPVAKSCWACNGKGFLRDIDTAGLLPCVVCKPQEDKT